jgi:hypothetical protein
MRASWSRWQPDTVAKRLAVKSWGDDSGLRSREDNVQLQQYRAKWVVPVDGRPIENGVVTVGDGRILALGDQSGRNAIGW